MDGDPVAMGRMYEQHAHFLQIELNTLHRDLSARYEQNLALRNENAALKAENAKLKRRIEDLTGKARVEEERELPSFTP